MADDYRQASLDIWDQMAAGWEADRREVWESSRPVAEWLVDALDPQPGETILELAAGLGDTGIAAASRLGPSGKLISTDFSVEMVDAARRRAEELGSPNVEFRTMDAERIDLADDSVDGVLCRWGTCSWRTRRPRWPRRAMEWAFESADDHWHYVMDLAGAIAMVVRSLPESGQAEIRRLSEERLEPVVTRPGYGLPGLCLKVLGE